MHVIDIHDFGGLMDMEVLTLIAVGLNLILELDFGFSGSYSGLKSIRESRSVLWWLLLALVVLLSRFSPPWSSPWF
jgi:hypothetical protein